MLLIGSLGNVRYEKIFRRYYTGNTIPYVMPGVLDRKCYTDFINILTYLVGEYHRYLIYTRWRMPHCGQAKIEAGSQALVVPTELTRSMIICGGFYCGNGQS